MTKSRIQVLAAALAALLLLLAAYSNFFRNGFHFDDGHAIVENASIRSLANWKKFFTDAYTFSSLPANATYRPIVTLSFALDYAARNSLDPVPFHRTQLLLMAIVSALLGVIAARVLRSGFLGVAAAALFAVHTANTETLNFLSSRSELLSAIGFLGALVVFAFWPTGRRFHLYLIPLAIGALAKAPVVVFAFVIVAWCRVLERRSWRESIVTAVPSLVAGAIILVLLDRMNVPEWTSGGGSRLQYLWTQPFVWLHYLRLSFFPIGLTADTDLSLFNAWYDTAAMAGYLFIIALVIAIRRFAKSEATAPIAFGLLFFAITLMPTSSFFPLAEVANEHRLFFPLMGFAIALVSAVALLARRRGAPAYGALLLFIAALAIGTYARNKVWQNEETLWRDVTVKSPRNGRAWMNYGLTFMARGDYRQAQLMFEEAARYTPRYANLAVNQGIAAGGLGDRTEAERHFLRALQLRPDRDTHYFYARWLVQDGRGALAEEHLRLAAKFAPTWIPPRALLLQLASVRGDDAARRALAQEILNVDPTDAAAQNALRAGLPVRCGSYDDCFKIGLSATGGKRHAEAVVAYRAALGYSQHADAWNNLGWSLASLGYREQAAAAYRQALVVDPGFERARNNLALLK
ncbi:MAG TPA: tetratricopeptide repeat protein [Thermoanaerobaculia bacterium]|nr:tetratricopeptide repeat protein [Thermoanaerobaculia bacterium]